jgi:serine/threonine protein kinase/formylglycine-generating enzyme required for sulfatase activity/energy-coupling factor transporter ATP-binding protein EcfA2
MNNLSNQTLRGYEIREQIGAGGFGSVYRAYQPLLKREVAIKVILPQYANQPDFIRRFEVEAELVARLEHPHIVPLFDYWREPDRAYLVMRWLRGGSLSDALQNEPFDLATTARLLDQMTGALSLAHRNGVVHRDIKPGNIVLDDEGNAYLTDFGIAKDRKLPGNNTQHNAIVGSLDYISPEQARSEPVTPRTDIYSLGVTLYEMITGHHPFENSSSIERLYKHIAEPLPEIDNIERRLQAAVNRVIQKATAKNPEQRYPDAQALAADFREAIGLNRSSTPFEEHLTQREHEILQMLVDKLSNKEIAQRLTVALSTVKWHVYQIYGKLGVRSRVQAIARARELNLIINPGEPAAAVPIPTQDFHPQNPYKGLLAFRAADSQDFFGRENLVKLLLKRWNETGDYNRFLAVVGPSGSGKSSLVKAGLIPALGRGELTGSEKWFIAEMLPGAHPLEELEVALTRVAANPSSSLHEHLRRDSRGLVRIAGILLPDDETELVLVIDQFEEVFTHLDNEAERMHFLDLLYTAVTAPRSRIRVVITLRADFYDRPLHYPQFGELVRTRLETILPLSSEELERAIVRPAERMGVTFEPGLVAAIIGDVNYQPGALPLLQYALTELFERRKGRLLLREAYQAIGGTVGALAQRAETIYLSLSEGDKELTQQIFLRLVTLGEGTEDARRRTLRSELLGIQADSDPIEELLDSFAAYRLLSLDTDTASRQPTVEVAHEALIWTWQRLRDWINQQRGDLHLHRRLRVATAEWLESNQESGLLARDMRLEQFEDWTNSTDIALNADEQHFLSASLAAQHERHRQEEQRKAHEALIANRVQNFQRASMILGGMVVLAVVAIIAAILTANDARKQRDTAFVAGTQAAGVATLFALQQGRIGTLAAGDVVISHNDIAQTPEAFLATETAIAILSAWQPQIQTFDGIEMVLVPAGCFWLGSLASVDEQPVNEVCFDAPFWIDRYEVSLGQFEQFDGHAKNPPHWDEAGMPRTIIDWYDANDFCILRGARLPTEAEWEYAARGPNSQVYPWGNSYIAANISYSIANPAPVDYQAGDVSWVGAYHLAGNVSEWTTSGYANYPYQVTLELGGTVLRGGAWLSTDADSVRAAHRIQGAPSIPSPFWGFRCVRDAE